MVEPKYKNLILSEDSVTKKKVKWQIANANDNGMIRLSILNQWLKIFLENLQETDGQIRKKLVVE